MTNFFELPAPNRSDLLTWQGDTLVANFGGISGSSVPRPPIVVADPATPLTSGSAEYPYGKSFRFVIEQESAFSAIFRTLSSLSTVIASAAGKGIEEVAKQVQDKAVDLLKAKQFTLRAVSKVKVSRTGKGMGDDDIFILAIATTEAFASIAASGLDLTLSTTLKEASGKRPIKDDNEVMPTIASLKVPENSELLGNRKLAAKDQLLFRLAPQGTKTVSMDVTADVKLASILPASGLTKFLNDVISKLKADARLSNGAKIRKPGEQGFDLAGFVTAASDVAKKVARLLVDSLIPRVVAYVIESSRLSFSIQPAERLEAAFGIQAATLALLDRPATLEGQALALADRTKVLEQPNLGEGLEKTLIVTKIKDV